MTIPPPTTTIAAIATAPAPAGVAIVRLSGPAAGPTLTHLFRGATDPRLDPRRLTYGEIIDPTTGDTLDRGLVVYMPGPKSFTGEDIVEFHIHGSPLIAQRLLRTLLARGIAPARPGEFTERAFLNGKLDLIQAEAVADLIAATSEHALELAEEQLAGRLSSALTAIGEPLRTALAELEASIDFSDEDIAPASLDEIARLLADAQNHIATLLASYAFGSTVKEGLRVLLTGLPNVGKSSLLNVLLGRERAIVTPISGTTRDLIEETATIGGYGVVLCDSAGITETLDPVEKIGIELARGRVAWADLVLYVVSADTPSETWLPLLESLRSNAREVWLVVNKIDLAANDPPPRLPRPRGCTREFAISAKTRAGCADLTAAIVETIEGRRVEGGASGVAVTNERQRRCLETASDTLDRALNGVRERAPVEIVSADVRATINSLDEIVGRTYTEDILGRIFSRFCIGK